MLTYHQALCCIHPQDFIRVGWQPVLGVVQRREGSQGG